MIKVMLENYVKRYYNPKSSHKLVLLGLLYTLFSGIQVQAALGTGIGGSFIYNQNTLQPNATFYVSSGTVTNLQTKTLKFNDGSTMTTAAVSGGGSSSLEVKVNSVQISSPTVSLAFDSNFTGNQSPTGTANISLNPGTTLYIWNSNSLQTGSTFYVSSATIRGPTTFLNPNNSLKAFFMPTSTETFSLVNVSSQQVYILFKASGTSWWRIGNDVTNLGTPEFSIYNATTNLKDIAISTSDVATINASVIMPNLSVSQPVKTNSSKQLITSLINLTSDVTGTLPSTNLPSNVDYTNIQQTISASKVFSATQTFSDNVGMSTITITKAIVWPDGTVQVSSPTSGGGSGTPGGANSNIQFNNSGSFGGDNGFQYDSSVSSVTIGGDIHVTNLDLANHITNGSNTVFYDDGSNIGLGSYLSLPSGTGNALFGLNTGSSIGGGLSNTAIGNNALATNSGSYNVAIGNGALGGSSFLRNGLVAIGLNSLNANTGQRNTAIGYTAKSLSAAGDDILAVGYQSYVNGTGSRVTALGKDSINSSSPSGNDVTAIGYQAMISATSGSNNTMLGSGVAAALTSGSNNTFIGMSAGGTLTIGSSNTVVGYNANVASSNLNKATAIGAGATVFSSNTIMLGSGETVISSGNFKLGNLLYDNTGDAGISGYVFTSNGSGSAPTWQAATGGGGASALEVFSNFDGTRSSPTASIAVGDSLKLGVTGSTATLDVDISSVTANEIHNQTQVQTGATAFPQYMEVGSSATIFGTMQAANSVLTSTKGISLSVLYSSPIFQTAGPFKKPVVREYGLLSTTDGSSPFGPVYAIGASTSSLEGTTNLPDTRIEIIPQIDGSTRGQMDFYVEGVNTEQQKISGATYIATMTVSNDLLDFNGSPGTNGYVLTSNGGGGTGVNWKPAAGGTVSISTLTAGATNFIFNQNDLQSASLHVSSAGVDGPFSVNGVGIFQSTATSGSIYPFEVRAVDGSQLLRIWPNSGTGTNVELKSGKNIDITSTGSQVSLNVGSLAATLLSANAGATTRWQYNYGSYEALSDMNADGTFTFSTGGGAGPVGAKASLDTNIGFFARRHSSSSSADLFQSQDENGVALSGTAADGGKYSWSRTKAQLAVIVPKITGERYFCSDCTTDGEVISTGTAIGSISRINSKTTQIN